MEMGVYDQQMLRHAASMPQQYFVQQNYFNMQSQQANFMNPNAYMMQNQQQQF